MKLKSAILLFILCCHSAFGQNLSNQNAIGGSQYESMRIFKNEVNGGYYLFGNSSSDISGNKSENSRGGDDYWFVLLDDDLEVVWDKTIGGSGLEIGLDAIVTTDKIFLSGFSNSGATGDKTIENFGQ